MPIQIKEASNKVFLQELKARISQKKLSEEEVFRILERPKQVEIITEFEATNLEKLTKEDWKKACETLEKSKVYQEEVKLWESIDNE